jgi:hypothetical protein
MMQKSNHASGKKIARGQTWRVVAEYQAAYPDPFVIQAGEVLAVGEKETEWRGWIWCRNQQGESRWVPEAFVEREGDTCVALCDYDSTELSVHVGEELIAGQEVADWLWCTNRRGDSGWVPAENLERV